MKMKVAFYFYPHIFGILSLIYFVGEFTSSVMGSSGHSRNRDSLGVDPEDTVLSGLYRVRD